LWAWETNGRKSEDERRVLDGQQGETEVAEKTDQPLEATVASQVRISRIRGDVDVR
jgi:hypothetical protein